MLNWIIAFGSGVLLGFFLIVFWVAFQYKTKFLPVLKEHESYQNKIKEKYRQFQNWKATGEIYMIYGQPDDAVKYFDIANNLSYEINNMITDYKKKHPDTNHPLNILK